MYIINIFTQLVEASVVSMDFKARIDSIPQNSKRNKNLKYILIIVLICYIIGMCITILYTNINIKNTINEITEPSEFETEIVSEDYNAIMNDNRGEDFYIDAKKCKDQIRNKAIIMTVVSFLVFISAFVVIKKLKNIKLLVAALILVVISYNVSAPLFIMPIEKPVATCITIPMYDEINNTTLEDWNKYTTTNTDIKTGDVTTIEYYGEKRTQYMFTEILICTDICLFVIVGLYLVKKRIQFLEKV